MALVQGKRRVEIEPARPVARRPPAVETKQDPPEPRAVYNFDPYYYARITDRTPTIGVSVSDYEMNLTNSNIEGADHNRKVVV
jgi:hypothetical protein